MRALRGERGEGSASYIAVVLLVAVIAIALVASGVGGKISSYTASAVCKVARQNCPDPAAGQGGQGKGTSADGGGQGGQQGRPQGQQQGQPQGLPQGQQQGQPLDYLQAQAVSQNSGGIGTPADLPTGGDRPYVPPKDSHGKPKKVRGKPGYVDEKGNTWEWDRLHKDHWDVQHPDGSHTNVFPDGSVRGNDNFPNKSKNKGAEENKNDYSVDPDTVRNGAIVVGGGLTLGAALWWGAKLLSPACGPFVVVCAIAL
jgi:hypothetical protein